MYALVCFKHIEKSMYIQMLYTYIYIYLNDMYLLCLIVILALMA